MESNLSQRRRGLEEKIPDITKTLDVVKFLQNRRVGNLVSFDYDRTKLQKERASNPDEQDGGDLEDLDESSLSSKPLTTTFELNDTLYAHAELEDTDTVYLWLGVSAL